MEYQTSDTGCLFLILGTVFPMQLICYEAIITGLSTNQIIVIVALFRAAISPRCKIKGPSSLHY